jgi:hypothetical protein
VGAGYSQRLSARSFASDQRVLRSIETGDGDGATRTMRAHLQVATDVQLLRWQPPGLDDASRGGRQDPAAGAPSALTGRPRPDLEPGSSFVLTVASKREYLPSN